jgi:tRNA-Thr(GGU) m(6)t(6)A37 methyltransferase TsaA
MPPRKSPSLPKNSYSLIPIGVVRSPIKSPAADCWARQTMQIQLDPKQFTAAATRGLAEFSHVEILYLFHQVPPTSVAIAARRPRGNKKWPKVGIFAQRAKDRPNRLGITICKLKSVKGLTIEVTELDAIDGTPVLDLRPYLQEFAPRQKVRQPAWSKQLMKNYFHPKKITPKIPSGLSAFAFLFRRARLFGSRHGRGCKDIDAPKKNNPARISHPVASPVTRPISTSG